VAKRIPGLLISFFWFLGGGGGGLFVVVVVLWLWLNCASVVGRKIPLNRSSISGGCVGEGYWRKAFNFFRDVLKKYAQNHLCFPLHPTLVLRLFFSFLFFCFNAPLLIYTNFYFAFSHFLFNALWLATFYKANPLFLRGIFFALHLLLRNATGV